MARSLHAANNEPAALDFGIIFHFSSTATSKGKGATYIGSTHASSDYTDDDLLWLLDGWNGSVLVCERQVGAE